VAECDPDTAKQEALVMSVFVYSISLLIIGGIIAVSFNAGAGLVMAAIAFGGIFVSLLRVAEAGQSTLAHDDIDRQLDDFVRHRPR
jgi:hypothetical protein